MFRKQILRLGSKKMFLNQVKNIFASQMQSLLPKRMFPSLATQGNRSGNNVSATVFPTDPSTKTPFGGRLWGQALAMGVRFQNVIISGR